MLSILIPTYNYNIYPLADVLHQQAQKAGIIYEIIGLDDGSALFHNENNTINSLNNCSYEILEKNIGRSAIRNLLAQKAQYENLLFLDADTIPVGDDFIQKYISHINGTEKVVYGGILYPTEKPSQERLLRWVYGNEREALPVNLRQKQPHLSFLTLHFLTTKTVFSKVRFNESVKNWGHEDTLFSYDLKKSNISVEQIYNPMYHLVSETNSQYIQKSESAIINLKQLVDRQLIEPDYIRISGFYIKLRKYKLDKMVSVFYGLLKPIFVKQLSGNSPSLLIFDLYRLGYLCKISS